LSRDPRARSSAWRIPTRVNRLLFKGSMLRLPLTARSRACAGLILQRRRWTKKLPKVLPGSGHIPGPIRSSETGDLEIQLSAIKRQVLKAEYGEGGRCH
jgi:hypothetical protein